MSSVNNSYSIPEQEFKALEGILDECEKVIERPNMTEIIRVGINILINEKDPKDISQILKEIGRRKPGRPKKIEENSSKKEIDLNFSEISDFQWNKIKFLFSDEPESKTILSEILFEFQNANRRGVFKDFKTNKLKRWRSLNRWQESGKWREIYYLLRPTFEEKYRRKWDEIFLHSYLSKRKTQSSKQKKINA